MWQYFDHLPVGKKENIASLGEGNTSLVPSSQIGPSLGLNHLYFKLETQNPTGSYKDRFASVAVSLMMQEGKQKILATSSGNTGAALAGYAARFGFALDLYVLEMTPEEKLLQSLAYGAAVHRVRGFGILNHVTDQVFQKLAARASCDETVLLVSAVRFCPREMQGVRTIAYEICDQLKNAPDHVFVPVGGGGLFLSCYYGFRDRFEAGVTKQIPHIHPVQPEGCATVVGPLSRGEAQAQPVGCASQISGLQVASVIDAQVVLEKTLETLGSGQMVSDEEIYHWQSRLVREEGIYCEPAGAAAIAGLAFALEKGQVGLRDTIV